MPLSPSPITSGPLSASYLAAEPGGGYKAPTVGEFFPGELLFAGTPFAMTRINMIQLLMTGLVCLFFVVAFRRPALVPSGVQNLGEMAVDFIRVQIVDEVMGKAGRRFMPYLAALFFLILAVNISGIIPMLNMPGSAVIGLPLLLALLTYVIFNYEGIKALGLGGYLKSSLFPPGVPPLIYLLVVPIEFVATFVLRPFTLTIRLLANMMAGHLLLVLFFSATSYLLFEADAAIKAFGLAALFMGFAFTAFEILVSVLQAYIFTLLTAVYISGAIEADH